MVGDLSSVVITLHAVWSLPAQSVSLSLCVYAGMQGNWRCHPCADECKPWAQYDDNLCLNSRVNFHGLLSPSSSTLVCFRRLNKWKGFCLGDEAKLQPLRFNVCSSGATQLWSYGVNVLTLLLQANIWRKKMKSWILILKNSLLRRRKKNCRFCIFTFPFFWSEIKGTFLFLTARRLATIFVFL